MKPSFVLTAAGAPAARTLRQRLRGYRTKGAASMSTINGTLNQLRCSALRTQGWGDCSASTSHWSHCTRAYATPNHTTSSATAPITA